MYLSRRKQTSRTVGTGTGRLAFSVVLGALLCSSVAFAGEADDGPGREDRAFDLGEVVVTGKKPVSEGVATVTERTGKDFRAWSDYSVADALRGIPGGEVTLAPGGLPGNGKQESLIRLRGFETTDVMIMVDGMPLTEPYMKRVDLSQILLDNVARIKVIKGPSSVLYGPNTAGGVINIVTQEGDAFRTRLEQRVADYKTFRTIGHHRGTLGPVRYALGGSFDRSDGFPISRDFEGARNQRGTLRENSDYERYNLAGRLSVPLGNRGNAAVGGGYYTFDGGVPYDMQALIPSTLWRKEWDRWYLNAAADYALTDSLGLKAQLYYDKYDNTITTYTDTSFRQIASGPDGQAVSIYDNHRLGYFVNPSWDLGPWSFLRAGVRYQRDDVSIQSSTGAPWTDYASETFTFSLEDEIRPLDRLGIVAGAGYNLHRKLKAAGSPEGPGDDVHTVDFQAGVLYRPWDFLGLHASAGRKTTFPTMRQLYGSNGFEGLREQTAMLYQIGADVNFQPRYPSGSLALFRGDVDNLIGKKELPPVPGDPTSPEWRYENVDKAVLQGVELALSWVPFDPLTLGCSYMYLDTKDKRRERALGDLDFRPSHLVGFQVRYQASFGLTVNSRYSYTSSMRYEEEGMAPLRVIRDLPARGVWDIHLGQKFPFRASPERFVEVFVDVTNVLDEYYEEDPGKAAVGRWVWGGVRFEF